MFNDERFCGGERFASDVFPGTSLAVAYDAVTGFGIHQNSLRYIALGCRVFKGDRERNS